MASTVITGDDGTDGTEGGGAVSDEYRLIIFPVVVGRGKRRFRDGSVPGSLTVTNSTVTSKGAVALTLQLVGELGLGDIEVIDGKDVTTLSATR